MKSSNFITLLCIGIIAVFLTSMITCAEDWVMNPDTGERDIVFNEASDMETDTSNFDKYLSSADDTIQKALETLDDITITETDSVVGAVNGIVKADGGGNISAAVADTDYLVTLAKDIVTTSPITGGTDNILPGADADITIAIPAATNAAAGHATAAHITAIEANTAKNTNVPTALSVGTVGVDTVAITSDGGADDVTLPAATSTTAGMLTTAKWAEIVANNAKNTNVSTALSAGTVNATTYGITSDGGADDIVLPEADTTNAGLLGADKWDEIVANTAKVTNATHTGEVTGSGALALDPTCISGKADTTIADADYVLFWDATDSTLKKVDAAELTAGSGDMSYSDSRFKVISATRDLAVASGNVSYTGFGFQPKAIIVFCAKAGSFTVSYGLATSTSDDSVQYQYLADTFTTGSTLVVGFISGTAGQDGNLNSIDADGFTIAWTKTGSPTGTLAMKFMGLK